MKRYLHRLLPRTLSSRLILLAAAALLIAQIISFSLLLSEHRRQWTTLAAAPAVIRILDAAGGDPPPLSPFLRRHVEPVALRATPPDAIGRSKPEIAARASEMLVSAGLQPRSVVAYVSRDTMAPGRLRRMIAPDMPLPRNRARLTLGVELPSGGWLVATARMRNDVQPIARQLILQTLAIFAAMLIPLLWIGRRLTAPLGRLTAAARGWQPPESMAPVPEAGAADVRELARAFNEMRARIDGMLAEKDHMLGAIGHDLRTPLAALRVRIESVDDEAERSAMAATIEDMRQILEDILALARIGHDRLPPQNVDLAGLAEAVAEDFQAIGADVRVVSADRVIAIVHTSAIRRALRNLVDNAVKYGERARIAVGSDADGAWLRVEDDGPGIDPARIGEMLKPFTRLERSRNRETGGSGLGLALVRAVVQAERGTISLANAPDSGGLIAQIRLPLTRA